MQNRQSPKKTKLSNNFSFKKTFTQAEEVKAIKIITEFLKLHIKKQVDSGASIIQIIYKIVFPMTKPGVIASAIYLFVTSWNEFIFALVLTRRHAVTAQIGIGNLQKFEGTEWGQMAAGAIVLILPAMIIAFFISYKLHEEI